MTAGRTSLVAAQGKIEAMVYRAAPFEEIEEFIGSIPAIDDDERAALWLLAWAEQRQLEQRRVVKESPVPVSG